MKWNQQVQGISPASMEDGVVTPRTKKKKEKQKKRNSGYLKDTARRLCRDLCNVTSVAGSDNKKNKEKKRGDNCGRSRARSYSPFEVHTHTEYLLTEEQHPEIHQHGADAVDSSP